MTGTISRGQAPDAVPAQPQPVVDGTGHVNDREVSPNG